MGFNPEKPMSYDAYKSWSKFSDGDYQEKYCHYSGEKSNGKRRIVSCSSIQKGKKDA